jgi:hypothetical protein
MAEYSKCTICGKRRGERFCPAKGEKICAVCCATEREVRLDCPSGCTYLIAAHRYEEEHRKPFAVGEIPFPNVEFSSDLLYKHESFLSGLGYVLVKFSRERRDLTDPEALMAITALAETYRTLVSGIYYEKPPDAPLPNALYAALFNFIQEDKKQQSAQAGFATLKDSEIFYALVYLARLCRMRTNGRPRARTFLEFLRGQYPSESLPSEAPRIIAP